MTFSEAAEYDPSAAYYDLIVGDRSAHVDFYTHLIRPGQASLLDLACGTGVITAATATALRARTPGRPLRVVGIDGSAAMLAEARRRQPDLAWLQGDIRQLPALEPFDLVVCCFHTLQAFDPTGLALVLRSARSVLGPGGRFAFDVYRPNWPAIRRPPSARVVRALRDDRGRDLEVRERSAFDAANQVFSLHWTLHDTRAPEPPLATFLFRFWQHEPMLIEALLRDAGFVVTERYGDLDRRPYQVDSKRLVLVCEAV